MFAAAMSRFQLLALLATSSAYKYPGKSIKPCFYYCLFYIIVSNTRYFKLIGDKLFCPVNLSYKSLKRFDLSQLQC